MMHRLPPCSMVASARMAGLLLFWFTLLPGTAAGAAWIWVEGEDARESNTTRHPWYDQVNTEAFSGNDFLSHFNPDRPAEAVYEVSAPAAGAYHFWVRANPVQARLSYRVNDQPWSPLNLDRNRQSENVARDSKPDLRFLAWISAGKVNLNAGSNTLRFRWHSDNSHHGYLDCFVLSQNSFQPKGSLKPDQIAAAQLAEDQADQGWFAFSPPTDTFSEGNIIDLRWLNEKEAGSGGFIKTKDGQFVHGQNGEPIKFWAVNGPSSAAKTRSDLKREARLLAKYGVNLVRIHGRVFNRNGEPDRERVLHIIDIVETMKQEGIYTHLSIYFPLWMTPSPNTPWLEGYSGDQHPFAALYFNPQFQEKYRAWWREILLTPSPATGRKLIDEPAVMGAEIVNEDSYFFWTFKQESLPDAQWRILERQFGQWLEEKYGTLEKAFANWNSPALPRDDPDQGRVAFRPLYQMFTDKTLRDQDTAAFLLHSQMSFYHSTYRFLRSLGFQGLIAASNWHTANAEVFGPLDKWSCTVGDFMDRHGYFSGRHQGDNAAWSLRNGHTYTDRSAWKFAPAQPGDPKQFVHPAMDVRYNGLPSMISETTWNRPNRYRGEAPLYLAAYGALQNSSAIVHFAFDGSMWTVKPNFWMQPWTLMSPAMMGQFPAAALIFRQSLIDPGEVLANIQLNTNNLLALQGTPLPQGAAFDELRLKDVPQDSAVLPGKIIDPLIHYAGQTRVTFTDQQHSVQMANLQDLIQRARQTVTASHGQLHLDYGDGFLVMRAPRAQGVSGNLASRDVFDLPFANIQSDLDPGHIVLVSLDQKALAESERILLQVMSEEKPTGFRTKTMGQGLKRILDIGRDPWRVRDFSGLVEFPHSMMIQPLDHNGLPQGDPHRSSQLKLQPETLYYLLKPAP